jgi:hypothetical protein
VKFGGYREVSLKKIIGPGDVKERQAALHVVDLAADIRELGDEPINALAAKKTPKGWLLIAGRDRFSALLLNNARTTWVHVIVEATTQELHDLEVSENLHRRDIDRNKLMAERVRKVAERITADRAKRTDVRIAPEAGVRGKTAEGEAREHVAAQLGTTPEAVRKAVARAEVRDEPAPVAPLPIETFGLALKAETRALVVAMQSTLRDVEKGARLAVTSLKAYGEAFGYRDLADVQQQAASLGAAARVAMPESLCPYCKDTPAKLDCRACDGNGFVASLGSVPPELLLTGDEACIQVDGTVVSITEYLAGLDAGRAPKKAKSKYDRKPGDCAHAYTEGAKQPGKCSQCGAEDTRYRIRNEADDGWEPAVDDLSGGLVSKRDVAEYGALDDVPKKAAKKKRGMAVIMPGETEARPLDDVVAEVAAADGGDAWDL